MYNDVKLINHLYVLNPESDRKQLNNRFREETKVFKKEGSL